jgi:hypothetical protein
LPRKPYGPTSSAEKRPRERPFTPHSARDSKELFADRESAWEKARTGDFHPHNGNEMLLSAHGRSAEVKMSRPVQAALLPGTDAIPCQTVEWARCRGKILIRYKDRAGYVHRESFDNRELAQTFFAGLILRMRKELYDQKFHPNT